MKERYLTVGAPRIATKIFRDGWTCATILLLSFALLATCVSPAMAQDRAPASTDTLKAYTPSLWGPVPARHDSVTSVFVDRPRPAWETAAMVPYWIIGIPFRIVYFGVDQSLVAMDNWGFFGEAAEYPGLKGPYDTYIMPLVAIGDLEGFTYGLDVTRPDFFGPGNMLFLQGSRSTRKAYDLSGGTLFQLGKSWELQVGGGVEDKNLTKYYGLGPESYYGDLSYYNRITTWAAFELDRDLGKKIDLELRTYFSQVEAREPVYEIHQSLGNIHTDNTPFGYPGESNGWTMRLALNRDNADQTGRPRSGGFQSLGVSLFQASDSSKLQYLTYHANAEKFFPLWHTDRTLAVRAFVNRISNIGEDDVPFTRLVTFQRPDELRGFNALRFYGMGSLGFSAEYRWPVWVARGRNDMGMDAYIFSDIGQVFDKTKEIGTDNMQVTGGVGLRLVDSNRGFGARFELGLSDEETIVRLKFSQTFQYAPKGILYGKNPTKVY